jgi:hypothetical protein
MCKRLLLRALLLASVALTAACSDSEQATPTRQPVTVNTNAPVTTAHEISVDDYLNSLPLGEVAFNPPDKMMLNDTINVDVKLGGPNLAGKLEGLIKEGRAESHPVKIGKRMEVQLAGAGFEITPITPSEQAISENAPTEWEWQVKAVKEGKLRLHLTLNAFVTVDGKDTRRKLQTFQKNILVEVTSGSRFTAFFYDNVGWIVTGLIIPFAGGIGWRARRALKRRRRQTPAP